MVMVKKQKCGSGEAIKQLEDELKAERQRFSELAKREREVDRRIANLEHVFLSGGVGAQASPLVANDDDASADKNPRRAIREARGERTVIRRALELQQRQVDAATAALSRAVCENRRPEYDELVRRHWDALLAVERTSAGLKSFQDEIEHDGLRFVLPVLRMTDLGKLGDPNSRIQRWLREAREHGVELTEPEDL
jgi:hypothetical protein